MMRPAFSSDPSGRLRSPCVIGFDTAVSKTHDQACRCVAGVPASRIPRTIKPANFPRTHKEPAQ